MESQRLTEKAFSFGLKKEWTLNQRCFRFFA